ncbi:MAG TPA: GAF domain-containing protein [Stellaceae bacterium]|nr:GAF domain-containing protein [Stellaceae bacterium]
MTDKLSAALTDLTKALADAADEAAFFRAFDATAAGLVGHRLFTLLVVCDDDAMVERIYSSNPVAYPLTGRKRMGPTPWGDLVLRQRRPYLGRDRAAIEWAFPDHALIESLGLRSVINIPIVAFGRVLGTMNLLDVEGHYDEAALAQVAALAGLLAHPFARVIDTSR